MTTSRPVLLPVDPNPVDVILEAHINDLIKRIGASRQTLAQSGLLRPYLRYCVKLHLATSVLSEHPNLYPSDEEVHKWTNDTNSMHHGLSFQDVKLKLAVQPACLSWARDQWHHLLGSLFLSKKGELDQASCLLLRVKDKDLITELYYRIKNGESSFRSISLEYGEGPEARDGGMIPLTPLSKLPFGLDKVIPTLNLDVLNGPYRHGSLYSIIMLKEFRPCELDGSVEDYLLSQQLASWIENAVDYLATCIDSAQPT